MCVYLSQIKQQFQFGNPLIAGIVKKIIMQVIAENPASYKVMWQELGISQFTTLTLQ